MYRFLQLYLLLIISTVYGQNTLIKNSEGILIPTASSYCEGSSLQLQVDDFSLHSSESVVEIPISDYNLIINNTSGEKDITFSADAGSNNKFSEPIDLDFSLRFFDEVYTQVVVGSNGRLVFTNNPVLNDLQDYSKFKDRSFTGKIVNNVSQPGEPIPSKKYNQVFKEGDTLREIPLAQIFAGYTNLKINTTAGSYKYKSFTLNGQKGMLFTFNSVIPHNDLGTDLGSPYTIRIILLADGTSVLNVKNKTDGRYNAILGTQNKYGNKALIPPGNANYNNGIWNSASAVGYVINTASALTPFYKWEVYKNGSWQIISTDRFLNNYKPTEGEETVKVTVSFAETDEIKTSEIKFRKIKKPKIEGLVTCSYTMSVTDETFDPQYSYRWYKEGDDQVVGWNRVLAIHRIENHIGNYYVKVYTADGTPLCDGLQSNVLRYEKQKFPEKISEQYCVVVNSNDATTPITVNLFEKFYPNYDPASGLEPFQAIFNAYGRELSTAEAANLVVEPNSDVKLGLRIYNGDRSENCYTGHKDLFYLYMPESQQITICASASTYDLKSFFEKPDYPDSYYYYYAYADDDTMADGSSVDVNRELVVTVIANTNCRTKTKITFVRGAELALPEVPVQERCSGKDNNANRFDFNEIKALLDPADQYNVVFYDQNDNEITVGANLNSEGYFWTGKIGDYPIYAKVSDKGDSSCFATSETIILRVYSQPILNSTYEQFVTKKICGISEVDISIDNVFDIIKENAANQLPELRYYDAAGNQLSTAEVEAYPINRGTPYILIKNGVCNVLKVNYRFISEAFPVVQPGMLTYCDDMDAMPDGIVKIDLAANEFKQRLTSHFEQGSFVYYLNGNKIFESNSPGDSYQVNISNGDILKVEVSGDNYCTAIVSATFQVNTPTVLNLSGNLNICYGEALSLQVLNASAFTEIRWLAPNGDLLNAGGSLTSSFAEIAFGKEYKVVAINKNGCATEYPFTPSDRNQPKITAIKQSNTSIEVTAEGGTTPYTYYFNGKPQNSNILSNPEPISYEIQVKSAAGCFGPPQTVYFIKINNAFTPNADGKNDVWKIDYLDRMNDVKLTITDRFGNVMYQADSGADAAWDGTAAGQAVPTGTYWYVVSWTDPVTRTSEQRQGWILLKNQR